MMDTHSNLILYYLLLFLMVHHLNYLNMVYLV